MVRLLKVWQKEGKLVSLIGGGIVRAARTKINIQNACEMVREQISIYLEGKGDFRPVFGVW